MNRDEAIEQAGQIINNYEWSRLGGTLGEHLAKHFGGTLGKQLASVLADSGLLPDDDPADSHMYEVGRQIGARLAIEDERDELRRRIERVLALHRSTTEDVGDPLVSMVRACVECSDDHAIQQGLATGIVPWPCATVLALTEQEHTHD